MTRNIPIIDVSQKSIRFLWLVAIAIATVIASIGHPTLVARSADSAIKYDFETGFMGWQAQTYEDSQACAEVLLSETSARTDLQGKFSLAMFMDLIGGDRNRSKGEVFVDMRDSPPQDENVPVDLTKHTVTIWIFAPKGAEGEKNRRNGFQVFVRDINGKSQYGSWDGNFVIGQWYEIKLPVSASMPKGGYMDKGFDPSQVIVVGVKMGTADGSTAKYKGLVYVDNIGW